MTNLNNDQVDRFTKFLFDLHEAIPPLISHEITVTCEHCNQDFRGKRFVMIQADEFGEHFECRECTNCGKNNISYLTKLDDVLEELD